jgi:hypothetical protein
MLEYWMQNGKAALSLIGYDISKLPSQKNFRSLLYPLYKRNGKGTKLAVLLFYPIYNAVAKEKRNRNGFASFFLKQITAKTNSKLSCIYCGKNGAREMVSYVFPFITMIDKYPNIYSRGQIRSLNLCPQCMLISFAANSRLLFKANSPTTKSDYISTVMFFSKDEKDLERFYNFIEASLVPSSYTNMKIFQKREDREYSYDKVWYPEELLAVLIDFISEKIADLKSLNKSLGALLFSCSRVSTGVSATTIYDSFEIINDLYPFIKAIDNLKSKTKNKNSFRILFRNLRKGGDNSSKGLSSSKNNAGDFTDRRQFFRRLLIYRRLDWKLIESLVMLKASENRYIPFLKSFIFVLIDQLSLEEKSTFQSASNTGYRFGKAVKENEKNPKRLKKLIFDFRRCRRLEDFLSLINLVQAQTENTVYADTFVHPEDFEITKTGFLIGFSNAIFETEKK